jgi:hypothetical protein
LGWGHYHKQTHRLTGWPPTQAHTDRPRHTRAMEQGGSPTLNLNEVEAQEVKEHMFAAGSKVAGGPASRGCPCCCVGSVPRCLVPYDGEACWAEILDTRNIQPRCCCSVCVIVAAGAADPYGGEAPYAAGSASAESGSGQGFEPESNPPASAGDRWQEETHAGDGHRDAGEYGDVAWQALRQGGLSPRSCVGPAAVGNQPRRCPPTPPPHRGAAGIGHYANSARGLAKVKEGMKEALGLKK